jgi:hypothetical protein
MCEQAQSRALVRALSATVVAVAMMGAGGAQAAPIATDLDGLFSLDANPDIFLSTTFPHATVKGRIDPAIEVEWFAFTGKSGAKFFADVDGTEYNTAPGTTTALRNSVIGLFNSVGQLLAFGDDGPVDPGSNSRNFFSAGGSLFTTQDAFLGTYTLPADGTYYLALMSVRMKPDLRGCVGVSPGILTRPDGRTIAANTMNGVSCTYPFGVVETTFGRLIGDYTLSVSLDSAKVTVVPEPGSLALFLAGIGAIGFARRRRTR